MQLITHQTHVDKLPESNLKTKIQTLFNQLSEENDIPPSIILAEDSDDIVGPSYAFIGNRGLLSDLFEEHQPEHPEFIRPYEWVCYIPDLLLYEALLLINNEDGYWMFIPESIVEANPELKWVLTDESQGGLSKPQLL